MTEIIVRQLTENDVSTADRIYRLAFGTFVGLHDPMQFSGDADPIRTRFRADPCTALAAEVNGLFAACLICYLLCRTENKYNPLHVSVIEVVEYYGLSGVTVEAVQSAVNPILT